MELSANQFSGTSQIHNLKRLTAKPAEMYQIYLLVTDILFPIVKELSCESWYKA